MSSQEHSTCSEVIAGEHERSQERNQKLRHSRNCSASNVITSTRFASDDDGLSKFYSQRPTRIYPTYKINHFQFLYIYLFFMYDRRRLFLSLDQRIM